MVFEHFIFHETYFKVPTLQFKIGLCVKLMIWQLHTHWRNFCEMSKKTRTDTKQENTLWYVITSLPFLLEHAGYRVLGCPSCCWVDMECAQKLWLPDRLEDFNIVFIWHQNLNTTQTQHTYTHIGWNQGPNTVFSTVSSILITSWWAQLLKFIHFLLRTNCWLIPSISIYLEVLVRSTVHTVCVLSLSSTAH